MQNDGKIQRLIFLIIFNIIILVSVVVLSNFTYARVSRIIELHQKTLYEITKHTSSKQNPHITIGNAPFAIGVSEGEVYVANFGDNTVSVIDGLNNTKIGDDIKVGKAPRAIGVTADNVYVANSDDNTVSVIDAKNNTKIGDDIKVGKAPWAIGADILTHTIYVANFEDSTVSVIDEKANKVVAKVMFNIEPFNAGHVECDKDKLIAPIEQQFYIWSDSECTAQPNQGFEFVSWQENLNGNSTQLIKFSSPPSILDSILDFLRMKPDKPEAILISDN